MVFVAAALGVGYWFLLNRTRFGFELKASGESPTAATAGGVDARRMVIIALLLSGAVAGLVGLPELLGRDYAYTLTSPAGLRVHRHRGRAARAATTRWASRSARCSGRSWTSRRWPWTTSGCRARSC